MGNVAVNLVAPSTAEVADPLRWFVPRPGGGSRNGGGGRPRTPGSSVSASALPRLDGVRAAQVREMVPTTWWTDGTARPPK